MKELTKKDYELAIKACDDFKAAGERLAKKMKTPEFKAKMTEHQAEWLKRNEGFAERGEDWRDVEIA